MHSSSTPYILKDRIRASTSFSCLLSNVLIHFYLTSFLFLSSHGSLESPSSSFRSSSPLPRREPPAASSMLLSEHQRYDGWYNNLAHADWGSLGAYIHYTAGRERGIECMFIAVCLCGRRKAFCNQKPTCCLLYLLTHQTALFLVMMRFLLTPATIPNLDNDHLTLSLSIVLHNDLNVNVNT